AVFAAVFEKSDSPDWVFIPRTASGPETTRGTFQFECKSAQTNGYILTWAAVYGTSANQLFAGIWHRNEEGAGWECHINDSSAALQTELDAFETSGGEPVLITRSAAADSYLSIWRTSARSEWWASHGLTGADLDAKAAQYRAKGIYPLCLNGSGAGSETRFA